MHYANPVYQMTILKIPQSLPLKGSGLEGGTAGPSRELVMVLLDTPVHSLCDNALSCALTICMLSVRMLYCTKSLLPTPNHHLIISRFNFNRGFPLYFKYLH